MDTTALSDLKPLVRATSVKRLFGDISDMTLWRWIRHRNFPQPQKIAGRNYFVLDQIEQWKASQIDQHKHVVVEP